MLRRAAPTNLTSLRLSTPSGDGRAPLRLKTSQHKTIGQHFPMADGYNMARSGGSNAHVFSSIGLRDIGYISIPYLYAAPYEGQSKQA